MPSESLCCDQYLCKLSYNNGSNYGVISSCEVQSKLKLQNEYHANVNILLWACWLQNRSIQLEASWLDDVLISVDTLSQLTVGRLQEVRVAA